MKKHNEGYTLAMVMVVITVLCLVTVSVLTASVQNLKAQRTSLDRLNAKYEAQGLMETLIGRLEQGIVCEDVDSTQVRDEATAAKDWLKKCGVLEENIDSISHNAEGISCEAALAFTETAGEYIYTVDTNITVTVKLELEKNSLGQITKYTISEVAVAYTSYEIGGRAA